jgi:Domain of unknown function (DUF4270)
MALQKRILFITIIALIFSVTFAGCSKLDTTDIGSDLLPAVDNVNTFEEILPVNTTQGIFNPDTTQVGATDDHVLGKINNDPLFGTTEANVYAQFKPTFYPYYYNIPKDSLVAFDSVVLCLAYKGNWGDSLIPLQLQVKEIANIPGNNGQWDSVYKIKSINYAPTTGSGVIGNATINIADLGKYMVYTNHKDSVKNQIRIKLSGAFVTELFLRDSSISGPKNSFRSDSLFRAFNNGIAIIANGSGNSLVYTNLNDANTKLEIHYRRKNGATIDTTFSSFKIALASTSSPILPSSTANYIKRTRPAFTSPNEIYLQATPGTYANLNIPALSTLSNRIVHRAEIIIEQIPFNTQSDNDFSAPDFLYIDLKDTTATDRWKPIYFDLNPSLGYDPDNGNVFFPRSGSGLAIDYAYHGGYPRSKTDMFNNPIKYYNFNITRYVQQIVTKHTTNYNLRLYAPYLINYPQYYNASISESGQRTGNNLLATGRVRVGSGTNPNYKMRLRIVYSKI